MVFRVGAGQRFNNGLAYGSNRHQPIVIHNTNLHK